MMQVHTTWKGGMALEAGSPGQDNTLMMDASPVAGSQALGLNPKKVLLSAVCGCTMMDVVELLHKMRVPFSQLRISASAEQTEDHPKVFKSIQLLYEVDAPQDLVGKVEKAVELSQTKYCGVSIMLRAHCPVLWQVALLPNPELAGS